MNTIRREWLLFRKRYVIWGILACVVLLSYLGFCGYVSFWIWRKYRLLMEMNRDILTEQRPFAKTLLWWSALCRMGLNRFNLIIPAVLASCSAGVDAYRRRFAGIQICGRSAWRSSYLASFVSNYLVTVAIVLLSIWMQVLRTRPHFQGASTMADWVILQKPLLYLLISFFCYTAIAHWVSFIAGQRSIWFALLAALIACQGIFLMEEWITHMLFPYGDGVYSLMTKFFFSRVDTKGVALQQIPFVGNQVAEVEQGAGLILLFLLITGVIACVAGCLTVKKSVRGITSEERGNRRRQYKQGQVYAVYGSRFGEETNVSLYPSSDKEELDESWLRFGYEGLDLRENLFVLCGAKKKKIEEALALVELDGTDDRKKKLKSFQTYPNKILLYELAVAWLCGDGFLELDQADRLDEQDGKGYHELQRSLDRFTEAGCVVVLYTEELDKVQKLVKTREDAWQEGKDVL